MKRVLYATTAIVGASLVASSAQAEEGIKIGLSGFMNTYYGISTRDADDDSGSISDQNVSHFQDATINFIGSTTLDNGIEVGARFELESFGHPGDEQFMWFNGEFGEITLGSHNSAGYRLSFDAGPPNFSSGIPINTGWIATFVPAPSGHAADFRQPGLSTSIDTHNDANTVGYMSPRIAGFKFGASWTPEPGSTSSSSTGAGDSQFGPVFEEEAANNAISFGASYVQDFNGLGFSVAGGYNRAFFDGDAGVIGPGFTSASGDNLGSVDDREQFMAGIGLSFAGISVGFDWANQNDDKAAGFSSNEGNSYSAGIAYSTGPWTASVDWLGSDIEGDVDNPADDELDAFKGGLDYALGPGITLSGSVVYADWSEEGGDDLDAVAGVLGTTVTF